MRYAKALGTTLTAIGLASVVTACATSGGPRSTDGFNVTSKNIALATRAQLAIASNDLASAVSLAEQAVERSPKDAGFRALLGNAYLASGRYASAEGAYRDSLSLYVNQPQVVLKLALVQIALGHKSQATGLLQYAGQIVDPADRGLALALAGEPGQAVALLQDAARQPGADARLRQNLAMAHALNNDWESARVVAAQDLAPEIVEQRMAEWLAYASPDKETTRVASFIGIAQSPADPGQPTRLALTTGGDTRLASAVPVPAVPQPAPVAAPQPVFAAERAAPVEMASSEPIADDVIAEPVEVAIVEPLAPPPPPPRVVARKAASVTVELPAARPIKVADSAPKAERKAPRPALSRAAAPVDRSLVRKAAFGNSNAVVQLGAYSTRDRVEIAWTRAVGRFGALRGLTPVTARFDGSKGSVYRLSVKGFASDREAARFCGSLKASGRECFVRRAAGDAPVSFASR